MRSTKLKNFKLLTFDFKSEKKGIALLLVMVILSAALSTSLGIFNVIFGEILISGELTDSFRAFYAADQGIERTFYRDRQLNAFCGGADCTENESISNLPSSACYEISFTRLGGITQIKSTGSYRCGGAVPIVKRGLQADY